MNSHCFKLNWSYSISFYVKCWWNFLGLNLRGPYLISLKKENENCGVVFTYSMKQAHRIRTFHVAVVQRRLRNVKEKPWCTVVLLTKPIAFLPFSLPSLLLLLKLPITLIQKFCYHGNMTSHLLSIAKQWMPKWVIFRVHEFSLFLFWNLVNQHS